MTDSPVSPLKWVGGKSKLADRIIKLIPKHTRYAEVFAGAGWVFFRKPQSRYETINDINSDLVAFYRMLQNHLEEFCKQFKWLLSSREFFEDFKAQRAAGGLTDIQRAARFYYTRRQAFGGKVVGQTFGVSVDSPPAVNLLRIEEEMSRVHMRLTGVVIENLPWREYLTRYDRPDTFFTWTRHTLVPRTITGKAFFNRDDYARMSAALAKVKGKFILSLNEDPEIRETFSAFSIRGAETLYSCNQKAAQKAAELHSMNYEPEMGLLGL